jgi:hypothetical protein
MVIFNIIGILAKYTMYPGPLCRFWKNLSGPMINFFGNDSPVTIAYVQEVP